MLLPPLQLREAKEEDDVEAQGDVAQLSSMLDTAREQLEQVRLAEEQLNTRIEELERVSDSRTCAPLTLCGTRAREAAQYSGLTAACWCSGTQLEGRIGSGSTGRPASLP